MAARRTSNRPPPGAYRHEQATRPNQPTVETAPLLNDETRAPKPFELEPYSEAVVPNEEATTDMTQEPQPRLAWQRQGHTSAEDDTWKFGGTPLYTREKVNPLTMIEQLRKPDVGVPLNLFDDFNGLPPDAQKWEFYQHSGHWQNRLIHGDSSEVMQSLIARDGLGGQVQMIYFDPPYGIGFKSNFMSATTSTEATDIPAGDTVPIKAFRDTYRNGIHSYLDGVHERLVLFRELLTESGSLFVQIGDDNVHLLAVICDEIFGPDNRVATITWRPTSGSSAKTLPESASYLLWYAKDKEQVKYRQLYEPLTRSEKIELMSWHAKVELPDGTTRKMTDSEIANPDGLLPEGTRIYKRVALTSQGASNTGRTCEYEYNGVVYHSGDTRQWRVSTPAEWKHTNGTETRANGVFGAPGQGQARVSGLDRLAELNRLDGTGEGGTLFWKWYEDEVPGRRIDNVWHQQAVSSNKRYSVQTANKIIERCLLMATDPGDLVLDPTCGSGVTAHMAERWGRRWITIDAGRVAIAIARRHLLTTVHPWYRTLDDSANPSAGFQYESIQKVSAATLAYDTVNDPENTIHLVDRPKKDTKRRRLTGPFTVESHNPLTWLPFDRDDAADDDLGTASGEDAERLLDALVGNPIRDSDGRPVLEISEIVAWPEGGLVTHEADCASPGRQTRITAAVMLAAPDVTVTANQIAAAAAETRRAGSDISDLIVVAPAFDDKVSSQVGPIRVHKVVTSRDLQIPGLSNEADSDALTLLGEPDIACDTTESGELVVSVLGHDTYDPATGNLRSADGKDVDCWMVDTDHDRTAFFPRLVYLPAYRRGDSNIKNLLKALGKNLDSQAAKALCGLKSQPFPPPQPGNTVAVKIITRTGAEMTTTVEPR